MSKINEDHQFTREEKIEYILKNAESVYDDNNIPTQEDLEQADDSQIDQYYQEIEDSLRSAGINEYNSMTRSYIPSFDNFIKEAEQLPSWNDKGTELPTDKEAAINKLREFLNYVQEYSSNDQGIAEVSSDVGKSKAHPHLYGFNFKIGSENTIDDIEVQVIFNTKEQEYIYAVGAADTDESLSEDPIEEEEEFYEFVDKTIEEYLEDNNPDPEDVVNEINMWNVRDRDTMDFESFMKSAKKGGDSSNLTAKGHHQEFLNKSFKSTEGTKSQSNLAEPGNNPQN